MGFNGRGQISPPVWAFGGQRSISREVVQLCRRLLQSLVDLGAERLSPGERWREEHRSLQAPRCVPWRGFLGAHSMVVVGAALQFMPRWGTTFTTIGSGA